MTSISAPLFLIYLFGIAATLVAAMLAFVLARRYEWTVSRWVRIGMMIVVPPLLLAQQLLKYASLHMYADFSHWLQLIQSIATTGLLHSATVLYVVPGGLNYLSVHFVPLIYLFALPFKLFPYPQTLIVLNVAIMSSAAIPLYLLAWHRTRDRGFAILCALLLFWYPTFQYTTLYEFEMLRFSIPILFWMLYAWERQRMGWYYAFVILATLVREEVGLTVAMFGVYLFLFERRRWHGFATAMFGFGAFMGITQVVMPMFRGDGSTTHIAAQSFAGIGTTPGAVLVTLIRDPGMILTTVFRPVKLANLVMLFIPLLGLPLLAPTALLGAFAAIGVGFLSGSVEHLSYMLYYVAPAVPFIFYALIKAWPKFIAWLERQSLLRAGALRVTASATFAIIAGALTANVFFGPSPIALQFWSDRFRPAPFRTQSFRWSVYRVTDHHRAARTLIARIPEDAIVSTQQFLMPRLASKRGVMIFPQLASKDGTYRANYVLLDRTNNGLRSESPAYVAPESVDGALAVDPAWVLVVREGTYILYVRPQR